MEPNLHGYLATMESGVCSPGQLLELTKLLGAAGSPLLNQLYLKLVDSTVRRCYETRCQLEECRQLIWLVFSHPAFCATERSTLLHWVDLFDRLFPGYLDSESGYSSGSSDRSSSCSPSPTQDKMFVYNPNFLLQFPPPLPSMGPPSMGPPSLVPTSMAPPSIGPPSLGPPSMGGLAPQCRRNMLFKRSHSEPGHVGGHVGGNNNFVGTRCKVQPKERGIDVTHNMTALMSWLKTLRLHKYYPKLSALSYDALLSLNEDRLGDITEGARRKILLNVQKLGGRHVLLHDIMGDLSKPGRFNPCITELHNMLMKTPFRLPVSSVLASHPDTNWEAGAEELIVHYTSVLETAGNIILANNIEEDSQKLFFKLLEDADQHAAFPEKQRRIVCEILRQCIDNYNYRNTQVIQLKRFDAKNTAHSVKIKYPIKPMNGINHQSGGSYNHTVYNKFNRPNKLNWQQSRASNGHMPLCQSHSAPVAPPSYSHFSTNIWSPPSANFRDHQCMSQLAPENHSSHNHTPFDFSAETLICVFPENINKESNMSPTSPTSSASSPATSPAASISPVTLSTQPSTPITDEAPPLFKLDTLDCAGLESLCSQIAECALAEK